MSAVKPHLDEHTNWLV